MSVAEQMGAALENTAHSVNIKERLDFSCAVFDSQGHLIANAPHMPVHLGSMSESVKTIIHQRKGQMKPGDSFLLNNPYRGGTHLPDLTVITPVFYDHSSHPANQNQTKPGINSNTNTSDGNTPSENTSPTDQILFYVASRGHHADIVGLTPGSMPPHSRVIEEEGVLIDDLQIVHQNRFLESEVREALTKAPYPARNVEQNLADFRAQVAANEKGVQSLQLMVEHFGWSVVWRLYEPCSKSRRASCEESPPCSQEWSL